MKFIIADCYKGKIVNPNDVGKLVNKIHKNPNFTVDDYMAILQSVQFHSKRGRIRLRLQHHVVPLIQPSDRLEKIRSVIESGTIADAIDAYRKVVHKEIIESVELKRRQEEERKILEEQNRLIAIEKEKQKAIEKKKQQLLHSIEIYGYRCAQLGFQYIRESYSRYLPANHPLNDNGQHFFQTFPYNDSFRFLYYISKEKRSKLNGHNSEWILKFYDLFLEYIYTYKSTKSIHTPYYINKLLEEAHYPHILGKINPYCSYVEILCVPMEDVNVLKGKIVVNLKNVSICQSDENGYIVYYLFGNNHDLPYLDYRDFKNYLTSKHLPSKHINDVIKFLFNRSITRFEDYVSKKGYVTFSTYISKTNFRWLYQGKHYFRFSIDREGNPIWSIFNQITLNSPVFTSEMFYFDESYSQWALNKFNNSESVEIWTNGFVAHIKESFKRNSFVHIIPQSCYRFHDIPEKYKNGNYVIMKFKEDYSHDSDFWYDKYGESGYDYLIWAKKEERRNIYMLPANKKYSNIRFSITFHYTSYFQAAFVISSFFSSNINNKRRDCQLKSFFNIFGIYVERPYYDFSFLNY